MDDNFCQNISYTTYLRGPFDNVFDDGVDRKSTQETAIMAIYTSVLEDLCSKQRWLIHPNEPESTWKNDHTRGRLRYIGILADRDAGVGCSGKGPRGVLGPTPFLNKLVMVSYNQ